MENRVPLEEARSLARAGMDALRRGDARAARGAFERLVAAGADDASACLALGLACRTLGDLDSALVAVDRALGREPRNLRALILKGDLLAGLGDARAASSFYLAVANHARAMGEVPADLRPEVERARALCERFAGQLEEGVRARLRGRGLLEEKASGRFLHSLDILFGHRQPYFQQPRYYFFPGLPQIQFFDRALFPWMDGLESATAEMRAELAGAMGENDSAFTPYVQSDPRRPRKDQDGLLDNPDWSALYLWKNGEVVPENAARFPRTLEAFAGVPLPRIPNRSPSILFSQLKAGSRIPPHCGLVNTRLICHLPLVVPGQCRFRVGNETREWEEGRAWAFDDTIEHEAWNGSGRTRVILLFEVWRPELSEEERALVTAMFEAIDAGSGERPAWEI